jgi:thymidylate synthase
MHLGTYENFTECYLGLLKQVMDNPQYDSSPRGQNIKEIIGASFTINNIRDRIPYVSKRKFSMSYMVAELVWYLSGNNSTEWISKYSGFWNNISDDGSTANSAYGARLFKRHDKIAQGRYSQIEYVVNELKRDPDSRRAVMHLRVPDDSIDAKLDVPCTLALQFFIRDNKLHQVVNMRSSDLVFGIAYDIPAFTIFQEMIANEVGADVGTYTHTSNSLHIYEKHFGMVEDILKSDSIKTSRLMHKNHGPMPPLTGDIEDTFLSVKKLCSFEEELQSCQDMSRIEDALIKFYPSWLSSPGKFRDWALVLTAARLRKIGLKKSASQIIRSASFSGYYFNQKGVQ